MADDRDQWADTLSAEPADGWLTNLVAEEDPFDRRMLWRLGSWGGAAIAAIIVAVLAAQSQSQQRRDQVASADLLERQSQQIQFVAKETQNEAKRLSQAIETLNGDRDRLYSRVTSVEQGLESVTGSIKRQTSATITPSTAMMLPSAVVSAATVEPVPHMAAAPSTPVPYLAAVPPTPAPPAPSIAPVAAAPVEPPARPAAAAAIAATAPLMAAKSIMAPPDAAATKFTQPPAPPEPAPVPAPTPAPETTAAVQTTPAEPPATADPVAVPVPRTEFGVDLGGANSVDGLRAVWRSFAKAKELTGLRPIMIVKERSGGYGMQLRLIAGPLNDAAAAARLCAALIESKRSCETSVFDGQRLALKNEATPEAAPVRQTPAPRKRAAPKQERTERTPAPPAPPPEEPAPPPKQQSSLSTILGIR
ncbi:MAG: hypothetical protein JWQ94_520 [Tardiphaga sp.]|jgi:hypothetical protein|nr:hypothetical protein [Tardiphaga sp.]